MRVDTQKLALQLKNPFKLSYGTSLVRENVSISISDGTFTGVGEAAVVPYYGETPERIINYVTSPAVIEAIGNQPLWLEQILDALPPAPSASAYAAIDIALHDLWGQHLGQPLYRLWGLNPARCPQSSFTVAMADDEAHYRQLIREASSFNLIKLKLGSGDWEHDLRLVQIARQEFAGSLCVDANGGWSAPDALVIIPKLAELGIIFVEQPVAKPDFDGWRVLRAGLPADMPPLIADESVQGVASVPPLAGLVDGINIKLAKCGGLRAARQMIGLARAYGMRVMIGCMIESSIAVTAAAHLTSLADYADLDGNLLISNDPYRGVLMENGRLQLPDLPGLGVIPCVE
jgi:L-alanine-DL-glutamate epimerase-like enolase superfamily enzyme